MGTSVLLQPGQVWLLKANGVDGRKIAELPERLVSYVSLCDGLPGEEYLVSKSTFKKWIRETDAFLSEASEAELSPAMALGNKIRNLRKLSGMRQHQVAAALGIPRATVAGLETGGAISASKHIPQLAELFKVPVDYFLTGKSESEITKQLLIDEAELVELYRRLPSERKIDIQKYIERQIQKLSLFNAQD